MKKIKPIILLTIILVSCTFSPKASLLKQAEKLMDTNPDSSWAILQDATKDTINYNKANKMKFYLLRAEAMNKKILSLDSVKNMEDVLEYYEEHGNKEENIQANYMMGCVYRDRGDSPLALLYYNKAINAADTAANDCNFRLVSRILGQIADIYNRQKSPIKELEACKLEASMALKAGDTLNYNRSFEKMGNAYHKLGNMDSVMLCTTRAYRYYSEKGMKDLAASALNPITEVYLNRKEYQKAKNNLDIYRKNSGLLDEQGEPVYPGMEYFYNYLGWYYKDTNKLDSALYCYRKLINYTNNLDDLEAGFKGLMHSYKILGRTDSVVKYAQLYADVIDTANIRNSANEVSKMQALYNYSMYQNKATEKEKEAKRTWLCLFIITFVCCSSVIILYFKNQHNYKLKIEALKKYHLTLRSLNALKQESQQIIKDNEMKINELTNKINDSQNFKLQNKGYMEQYLMKSVILKHLKSYAQKAIFPTVTEWAELEEAIMKFLPDFYHKLGEYEELISKNDYKICLLTRLSFTVDEISHIMGVSKQNISNRRSKLNFILFSKKGTKDFDWNIQKLA